MRDHANFTNNEMIRKLLAETLKERRTSVRKMSTDVGVSHATILRFLQGQTADPETVKAVAGWLGVNPATALNAEVPDSLAAKIALLIEQKPDLCEIFSEAVTRVLDGRMDIDEFQELAAYAAYRFNIKLGENYEASDNKVRWSVNGTERRSVDSADDGRLHAVPSGRTDNVH